MCGRPSEPVPVALRDAAGNATRRVLVQHRADHPNADEKAFGHRSRLLNNLGLRLAALRRREEALSVSEEAVRMLAPHLLRLPRAFESWMRTMLGVYAERCEETETEPDGELLGPIREALARLEEDGDSGA